jgi:hypothetical protein
MDENIKILLNTNKNIDSVNVDNYNKIELQNKRLPILEYDIRNVLSATEIFDLEREANEVYRIYGKMEYMSLLNGLRTGYYKLEHFFLPIQNSTTSKSLLNSFDFYLVKPAVSEYTGFSGVSHIRYFQVVATPNEFELFPMGFANNIYNEQTYGFSFNADFDVSNYVDNFGFPLTELFLYVVYKKWSNPIETLSFRRFLSGGTSSVVAFSPTALNIDDYVKTSTGEKIGDIVEYSKSDFYQAELTPQTFFIKTPYIDGINKSLIWKYNPFIPFRLRYFSNETYRTNINNPSYEQVMSIPYYATALDDGNYVWRTILPQGYVDPLTGIGVDYPFVNKKRYLFSTIVFDVVPDLSDADTYDAFKDIKFGTPVNQYITPMSDLNNIGKPCL